MSRINIKLYDFDNNKMICGLSTKDFERQGNYRALIGTGIKDCNSQEIFEGDVIRLDLEMMNEGTHKLEKDWHCFAEVYYADTALRFRNSKLFKANQQTDRALNFKGAVGDILAGRSILGIEIIKNIYIKKG